jgi:predicted PurR-regulated permease PerM
MFWWLSLPTPLLWGLVMGLLAIVPVLGAFVVWIPAAIFLALDGNWEKAIILFLWGGLVVSSIDNLLYPMLVGNRLKLHTVPAFISLVGRHPCPQSGSFAQARHEGGDPNRG